MGGSSAGAGAQAGIGVLQVVEAKNQADALKRQANFDAQQAEFNAKLVDAQRRDIEARVDEDVFERNQQVNQMLGAQKVSLAAQGIEVEGEIGDILERDERVYAEQDIAAIKNNAWKEAMGLEIEALDLRSQARFTRVAGKERARSTLVTGGLNALSTGFSAYDRYERRQIRSKK